MTSGQTSRVIRALACAFAVAAGACGGSSAQRRGPATATATAAAAAATSTAVAFVVSTQAVWVGNEEYEKDPDSVFHGALNPLKQALDKLDLGHRLPAGSRTVVVGYGSGARILHAMSPATELTGSVLGVEQDYRSQLGSELVAGIQVAFDELAKIDARRKVIVVVGDGGDTHTDTARARLTALAARAATDHVEVFALVLRSEVSVPTNAMDALTPHRAVLASSEDLYPELTAIFPPAPPGR